MNPSDRAITQKIRKAIHHDKSLSRDGRNIAIFIQEGKVTRRGPVRSEQEQGNLEAKAVSVAGHENVSNQAGSRTFEVTAQSSFQRSHREME
jgi:hyperosmotically inducible protein